VENLGAEMKTGAYTQGAAPSILRGTLGHVVQFAKNVFWKIWVKIEKKGMLPLNG